MTDEAEKINPYFFQLVVSLQAGAIQQMGKIASPISGKVERNLEMARQTIDMIDMLKTKMQGNLTPEEDKFIGHILYELRLNYVDELKKDGAKKDGEPSASKEHPAGSSQESATESTDAAPSEKEKKE